MIMILLLIITKLILIIIIVIVIGNSALAGHEAGASRKTTAITHENIRFLLNQIKLFLNL